jgi:hypothetical protein
LMKHRNSLGEEPSLLQLCLDQKIRENRREQRGPARTGSLSLAASPRTRRIPRCDIKKVFFFPWGRRERVRGET